MFGILFEITMLSLKQTQGCYDCKFNAVNIQNLLFERGGVVISTQMASSLSGISIYTCAYDTSIFLWSEVMEFSTDI